MIRLHYLRHPLFASQAILTIVLTLVLFSVTACQDAEETAAAQPEAVQDTEADTAANATGRYIMETVWTPRLDQEDDLD
jgi:hypothetical protein